MGSLDGWSPGRCLGSRAATLGRGDGIRIPDGHCTAQNDTVRHEMILIVIGTMAVAVLGVRPREQAAGKELRRAAQRGSMEQRWTMTPQRVLLERVIWTWGEAATGNAIDDPKSAFWTSDE